jgi:adenylate kinase
MARKNPNIIITGTPGVGKTTHAEQLARATGFTHLSINQIVKDEGFHEGKDEETGSWVVDEDKVPHPLYIFYRTHMTLQSAQQALKD